MTNPGAFDLATVPKYILPELRDNAAWISAAELSLSALLQTSLSFTVDDIKAGVPKHLKPATSAIVGAFIRRKAEDGVIESPGFSQTLGASSKGRPVRLWRRPVHRYIEEPE